MLSSHFVQFSQPQDNQRFYHLLKQLRPHLSFEDFLQTYDEANNSNQFQFIGIEENDHLVALMGYRILFDFVHGKHLYIDDLVSSESHRSKGYGAMLLEHADKIAKENGCSNLRLCTGVENERGKTFYEKNAWQLKALVFKKKL